MTAQGLAVPSGAAGLPASAESVIFAELRALRADLGLVDPEFGYPTIEVARQQWVTSLAARAQRTVETYEMAARRLYAFLVSEDIDPTQATTETLTEGTIEGFVLWLMAEHGRDKHSTVATYKHGVTSFCRFLARRRLVPGSFRLDRLRESLKAVTPKVGYRTPRIDPTAAADVVAAATRLTLPPRAWAPDGVGMTELEYLGLHLAALAAERRIPPRKVTLRMLNASCGYAAVTGRSRSAGGVTTGMVRAGLRKRDLVTEAQRVLRECSDPAEIRSRIIPMFWRRRPGRAPREHIELLRDRALLLLLFSSAMRRAELVSLNRSDIRNGECTEALITGKGNKERLAFFDEDTREALQAYLAAREDRHDPVFIRLDPARGESGPKGEHWRLDPQSVWLIARRYGKAAGVDVSPHAFRHAQASLLMQNGAELSDVQDILGHASPETTKRIYVHMAPGHLRSVLDRHRVSVRDAKRVWESDSRDDSRGSGS